MAVSAVGRAGRSRAATCSRPQGRGGPRRSRDQVYPRAALPSHQEQGNNPALRSGSGSLGSSPSKQIPLPKTRTTGSPSSGPRVIHPPNSLSPQSSRSTKTGLSATRGRQPRTGRPDAPASNLAWCDPSRLLPPTPTLTPTPTVESCDHQASFPPPLLRVTPTHYRIKSPHSSSEGAGPDLRGTRAALIGPG